MSELGVDHVDTAEFYGHGFANDVIRQVLRAEDGVLVATKVGATPVTGGRFPLRLAQRPEELRASVEDNLSSLGADILDLVSLRRTDGGPGVRASGDQVVDLDDQLAILIALRDEGKIGAIGLSAVTSDVVRTSSAAHLEANLASGSIVLDEATMAALDAVPSRSSQVVVG
jgi:pyridoxine 4-dehydrogenase